MSKMSYSESEPDFSNSLSTLAPIFSDFESDDSESDSNSMLINLNICIFLPYICILLNKLADDFSYQFSKQNQ